MLGKTANGLFWMYRYLERAENTARLIETGQRIALTRSGSPRMNGASVLQTAGVEAAFNASGTTLSKDERDRLAVAREGQPILGAVLHRIGAHNARLVRTAITNEVWEAMNSAYMAHRESRWPQGARTRPERGCWADAPARGAGARRDPRHDAAQRCLQFRPSRHFLERADNTARILDVKYYVLLPSVSAVGSSLDNVQWETILRSVAGRGGFRMEYGNYFEPRDIAQFLILDKRMPRSLAFCVGKLRDNLGYLASNYGTRGAAFAKADAIGKQYLSHDIEAIFDYGLHEFLQKILYELTDLGGDIETDYRFYK
jgi:uncharacterized alpha-E superfamily protein